MDSPAPAHETKPEAASTGAAELPDDDYAASSRSKGRFRFKSSSSSSRRHGDHRRHDQRHDFQHHEHSDSRSHSRSNRHHKRHHSDRESDKPSKRHHSHKHRQKHRDKSKEKDRNPPHSTPSPPQNGYPNLSPEEAFRESLFDALGDDEGAAYWESVYGQPIHTYDIPSVARGPEGMLEQMDEEEYASYVRARMWERTREGMVEEQERLRAERARAKARENEREGTSQRAWEERCAFERAMEESLERGARRRKMRVWEGVWMEYLARWEEIGRLASSSSSSTPTTAEGEKEKDTTTEQRKPLRNLLFWPVESGKRKDITPQSVEEFLRHAPPAQDDLLATLKAERIRWHPDKIQHRYAVLGIDEVVMRSVTEVFQIVDRLWSAERER